MLWAAVRFGAIYSQMRILETINNKIIFEHYILSPNKATEDTLRSIILENIRFIQRRIDQKCYNLWVELLKLGEEIAPGEWGISNEEIEQLREERRYKHEHDYSTEKTEL